MPCVECLLDKSEYLNTRNGQNICLECAELYYFPCSTCLGLVPREELIEREGNLFCLECSTKPIDGVEPIRLNEAELEALIADFIRLHAEEKRVKDQLESVKDKLKKHAASEQRISNSVLLRSGENSVKCGYSTRVSYDTEKLAALEREMGEKQFSVLFEREVKFSPVKESLEVFLTAEWSEQAEARDAIRAAMEIKEIVTIAPANPRSGSKKSSKN